MYLYMKYEKLLAVVAGPYSSDNQDYANQMNTLEKSADHVYKSYFSEVKPMLISGISHGLMAAGLSVLEAIRQPGVTWEQTRLLNSSMYGEREFDEYLARILPPDLQGLIVIAAGANTSRMRGVVTLGNRGPTRDLDPGTVWVSGPFDYRGHLIRG